jgi:hypothetical protein
MPKHAAMSPTSSPPPSHTTTTTTTTMMTTMMTTTHDDDNHPDTTTTTQQGARDSVSSLSGMFFFQCYCFTNIITRVCVQRQQAVATQKRR